MLNAARTIIARDGLGELTMSGIAKEIDAPSGSVYHRFKGRDALLETLWSEALDRFEASFTEAVDESGDCTESNERLKAIALRVLDHAETHRAEAVLLLFYRREDLPRAPRKQDMKALAGLAEELRLPPAVVGFCVARLPLMVLRSALRRNAAVPNWERRALGAMIDAVLQSSTEDPEGAF